MLGKLGPVDPALHTRRLPLSSRTVGEQLLSATLVEAGDIGSSTVQSNTFPSFSIPPCPGTNLGKVCRGGCHQIAAAAPMHTTPNKDCTAAMYIAYACTGMP